MTFRYDINGLRAIAVLSVVVFHFADTALPGGFIGVDVFFVISGYLMTAIIFKGLDKDTFSLIEFYRSRVKRIIPALATLSLALFIFGFFFLHPIDFATLSKHIASSLTFTSNILYWTESSYFSTSSLEKWLLHSWSLSVEWQFYLLYPIALLLLNKFLTERYIKTLIVAGFLLGFVLSVFVTYKSSSAAYFLLPTRAWEMLAGALIYLFPIPLYKESKFRNLLQITGLLLIVISCFIFDSSTPWPGYSAALPVLGTSLVIWANSSTAWWCSNFAVQNLGKWSYSIYLWHWPLVVLGYLYDYGNYWYLVGIPLSVFLGYLSYNFVETKSLSYYRLQYGRYLLGPLAASIFLIFLCLSSVYLNGFINRLGSSEIELANQVMDAKDDWEYPKPNLQIQDIDLRLIQGRSKRNILVMGASHIEHIYPYVVSLNSEHNIYFLTQKGCFVTPSVTNPKWSCSNLQNYQKILNSIEFDTIVTSFYNFDSYLPEGIDNQNVELARRTKDFDAFLKDAKQYSQYVYLILGEPRGPEFNPQKSLRKSYPNKISLSEIKKGYQRHNTAIHQLEELDGVTIIDPLEHLCNLDYCLTRNDKNKFYYKDDNHMRPWYAKEKLRYLDSIFL